MPYEREALAWAAGLFDGEGSTTQSGRSLVICMRQNDPRVLHRFQQAVGLGKVYGPYSEDGGKRQMWQWRATGWKNVQAIIAMLWTFLSPAKREQAVRRMRWFYAEPPHKMGAPRRRPEAR